MTAASPGAGQRSVWAALVGALLVAAAAWAGTVVIAHRMGVMPGTVGLALPAFVGIWVLMMAAMMLPAVSPVARLYVRTIVTHRVTRLTGFIVGYLLVWAAAALPAYALAWAGGGLANEHPQIARWSAVATFALVAVYQLSPLKDVCLRACRSPLGLLLRYAGYRGRIRDLRVGAHHGLYCLGCCWALFVALIVLGMMNVLAMLTLAVVVAGEKLWVHGVGLSRVVAAVSVALAIAAAVHPSIAAGLYTDTAGAM